MNGVILFLKIKSIKTKVRIKKEEKEKGKLMRV